MPSVLSTGYTSSKYDSYSWQSTISGNTIAQDTLFLGGYSQSLRSFAGMSTANVQQRFLPLAGRFNLTTQTYNWVKIYMDEENFASQIDGLAIKSDDSILALAGSITNSNYGFVFLVDPVKGGKKSNYFRIQFDQKIKFRSSSMLFAGKNRLYLTGEVSFRGGKNGKTSGSYVYDYIQLLVVEYDVSTYNIDVIFKKITNGTARGSAASLLNLGSNSVNGQETVIMGAGFALQSGQWQLGLLKISPFDGSIKIISIQYMNGQYFYNDPFYQEIAFMQNFDNDIYAVTRSAQMQYRGAKNFFCKFAFTDSTWSTINNNQIKLNMFTPVSGSGPTIQNEILAIKVAGLDNLHGLSFDTFDNTYYYWRNGGPDFSLLFFVKMFQETASNIYVSAAVFTGALSSYENYQGFNIVIRQGYFVGSTIHGFENTLSYTNNPQQIFNYETAFITSTLKIQNCNNEISQGFRTNLSQRLTQQISSTSFIPFDQWQSQFQNNFNQFVKYKTYDLDFTKLATKTLCGQLPVYSATAGSAYDQLIYLSYNQELVCPFTPNTVAACDASSQWVYAVDQSKIPSSTSIIQIDSINNKIVMKIPDSTSATIGSYLITVIGTLPNGVSRTFTFKLRIAAGSQTPTCGTTCFLSTQPVTISVSESTLTFAYSVGSSQTNVETILDKFTVSCTQCFDDDLIFSILSITPATTVSPTFPTPNVLNWYTTSVATITTFTIVVAGKITSNYGATVTTKTIQVIVTMDPTCYQSYSAFTITDGLGINGKTYSYAIGYSQFDLPVLLIENSNDCSGSDIDYDWSVTPANGKESMFRFDIANKIVSWYSGFGDLFGTFTIIVTGKINRSNSNSVSGSLKFTVIVTATCSDSTEVITITSCEDSNTTPLAYSYSFLSTDINQFVIPVSLPFSQDSQLCTNNDFKYSFDVNAETAGQDVSFVTLDANTNTVIWNPNIKTNLGIFTIIVYASINSYISYNEVTLIVSVPPCSQSNEIIKVWSTESLKDYNYTVMVDSQQQMTFKSFTQDSIACSDQDIQYSLIIIPNQFFITFNQVENSISWITELDSDIRAYQIKIVGTVQAAETFIGSNSFKLTVLPPTCAQSTDKISIELQNDIPVVVTYSILDIQGQYQFNNKIFVVKAKYCSNSDLKFSFATTSSSPGQSTTFIQETLSNNTVSWYSKQTKDVGSFQVEFIAILQNQNQTFIAKQFLNIDVQLRICDMLSTILLQDFIQDIVYIQGNKKIIKNLVFSDSKNGACWEKWTYQLFNETDGSEIKSDQKNALVQFDQNTRTITVYSNKTKAGKIPLRLCVSKMTQYNFTSIPFNIEIVSSNPAGLVTQQDQQDEKNIKNPPYWKQIKADRLGIVTIDFSESFIVPKNLSLINSSQIEVSLLSAKVVDDRFLRFNWTVIEYQKMYMKIKLVFFTPAYISCNGYTHEDSIQIKAIKNYYFVTSNSSLFIARDSKVIAILPPQLTNDKIANDLLNSVTQLLKVSSIVVATSSIFANILLSASLTQFWSVINALQLIVYTSKFNLYFPANALDFFQSILEIADFNILPTDQVFDKILPFEVGDSQSKIKKLATLFLVFVCGLIAFVVWLILRIFKQQNQIMNKVYDKLSNYLFWNSIIRYILESYLPVTLNFFMIIRDSIEWSDFWSVSYSLQAIAVAILYSVAPIAMTSFFRWKFSQFRCKKFISRFGEVIQNLNFRNPDCTNIFSIFCYRRIVEIMLIIFAINYPWLQASIMTFKCVLVVIYFGYSLPFHLPRDRRMEYFNEVTILICCYHLFLFTDFVDDVEIRYKIGYSMMAFTCLNISVNLFLIGFETLGSVQLKFKQWRQNWRRLIQEKKREERKNLLKQLNIAKQTTKQFKNNQNPKSSRTIKVKLKKSQQALLKKKNQRLDEMGKSVMKPLQQIIEVESEQEQDIIQQFQPRLTAKQAKLMPNNGQILSQNNQNQNQKVVQKFQTVKLNQQQNLINSSNLLDPNISMQDHFDAYLERIVDRSFVETQHKPITQQQPEKQKLKSNNQVGKKQQSKQNKISFLQSISSQVKNQPRKGNLKERNEFTTKSILNNRIQSQLILDEDFYSKSNRISHQNTTLKGANQVGRKQ